MKKFFVICALILLLGCGFRPMFSGHDVDIYIPPISGINGIDLRNALNAKFGGQKESNATYTLTVKLGNPITKYKALEPTGYATWQEIELKADYTLTHDGKTISSGSESAAESYTFVSYLVASNASYNNAVEHIINVLADKISTVAITQTQNYEMNKDSDK